MSLFAHARLAPMVAIAGIALTACGSASHPAAPAASPSRAGNAHVAAPAATKASAAARPTRPAIAATPVSRAAAARAAALCLPGATACVSTAPQAVVRGPGSLSAKLSRQLQRSNALTTMHLGCPRRVTAYPFTCDLDASVSEHGVPTNVTGTVQVIGVETVTDTYAYEVNYVPVRG